MSAMSHGERWATTSLPREVSPDALRRHAPARLAAPGAHASARPPAQAGREGKRREMRRLELGAPRAGGSTQMHTCVNKDDWMAFVTVSALTASAPCTHRNAHIQCAFCVAPCGTDQSESSPAFASAQQLSPPGVAVHCTGGEDRSTTRKKGEIRLPFRTVGNGWQGVPQGCAAGR